MTDAQEEIVRRMSDISGRTFGLIGVDLIQVMADPAGKGRVS